MAWTARTPAITATTTKRSARCLGAAARRKLQTATASARIQVPAGPDRMPDTKPATSASSRAASSTHQGRIHSARTVANSPAMATSVAADRGSTWGIAHSGSASRKAATRPYMWAMHSLHRPFTLALAAIAAVAVARDVAAQAPKRFTGGPVTIVDQGSFFIGGQTKITEHASIPGAPPGQTPPAPTPQQITIGQVYVQFQ